MPTSIVTVRKGHVCVACGADIEVGSKAFLVTSGTAYQKYPNRDYFHFNEGIPINEFEKMSYNTIRAKICISLLERRVRSGNRS